MKKYRTFTGHEGPPCGFKNSHIQCEITSLYEEWEMFYKSYETSVLWEDNGENR